MKKHAFLLTASITFASCTLCAATAHRAPLEALPIDTAQVVTNVTFEGLATTNDLARKVDVVAQTSMRWFADTQSWEHAPDAVPGCRVIENGADATLIITNTAEIAGTFRIPDRMKVNHAWRKVTGVSCSDFCVNDSITSVEGGRYCETIDDQTFSFCMALRSVSLPAVNSIREVSFYSCSSLVELSIGAFSEMTGENYPWGLPSSITNLKIKTTREYYDDWKTWADTKTDRVLTVEAAANMTDVAAAVEPLATKAALKTTDIQVAAIGSHLNAEDAHFVSTNYDSQVHIPEAFVEVKQNNNWITIWREMTRWNAFTGAGFDWTAWQNGGGFHAFKTNVTAQIADLNLYKADRAWGYYNSATGLYSPAGVLQVSATNIMISANMSYQEIESSGVWVLSMNTGTWSMGSDTNGFFRVKDGDGNVQFEIIKGDKREVGADCDGFTTDTSTPPICTIHYSVESDNHPTLQICDDLNAHDWKSEGESGFLASVSWSGQSGDWTATVQRYAVGNGALFIKATYMTGGDTYINNRAPVGMDAIILNGTKYYLGTATIDGKTVLTLSTSR